MAIHKADIVARLKKDLGLLEHRPRINSAEDIQIKLGPIDDAFPGKQFPLSATHEFICESLENIAATNGFIAFILSTLMSKGGISVWISSSQTVFPPALKLFNVLPDKIIFITLQHEKEKLWVIEEALKCESITAVIAEIKDLGFMVSRRFQLAVEQSGVTGLFIRNTKSPPNINAAVSRWKILSIPSQPGNGLPGLGLPCWNVELLKIRNGKPGKWQIEYSSGILKSTAASEINESRETKRKAG